MNISQKLHPLFSVSDPYVKSALRDLFALGCYLHAGGHETVRAKTCLTVLRAAKVPDVDQGAIIGFLLGNETECLKAAKPHCEVSTLMDQA